MKLLDFLMTEQKEEEKPLTVSELNQKVKQYLESDFSNVCVEGEIVGFSKARSGHWYFSLHDENSQIKAVCYAHNNCRIRFQPCDGLKVRVRGKLTVYLPKGEYQIIVESLLPVGEGALKVAFEQIKSKLEAEGLFDESLKRPLPMLPRRVGIVTSPDGAAFFDILNVLTRRTKTVHITLIPARVQGENAGEEIVRAIKMANLHNLICDQDEEIDVLIVGRGGGAPEDLWAFNEEEVARAIRASQIPVISAVGHEIDFTIADYVADCRAPTPSAAAEIVAEAEENIKKHIRNLEDRLAKEMKLLIEKRKYNLREIVSSFASSGLLKNLDESKAKIEFARERLFQQVHSRLKLEKEKIMFLDRKLSLCSPLRRFSDDKSRLKLIESRLISAMVALKNRAESNLKAKVSVLNAVSPLSILDRGFAIVENKTGKIITDSKQVSLNEELSIKLAQGKLRVLVLDVKE
ncbi:MAG: exodeoxyribonuclease VII large subunit [Acidobacteria bacterium]|jgi:exodeoxyribonuclease VII large subunit|nr:MAG: exodeoxyribonuclease VII large subunit [Acidobacteriota bacterium]GIU81502.1 MAG: exodeoxyribonuclease 7 large subunit [Pyrinomonadaceae bacterium]